MKKTMGQLLIATLITVLALVAGCENDCKGPDAHDVCKDGVAHKSGSNNPEENCDSCHKDTAATTPEAPACESCH